MYNRISGGFSPPLSTPPRRAGLPGGTSVGRAPGGSQSTSARRRTITGASDSMMRRVVTYPVGFNVPHELIETRNSLL